MRREFHRGISEDWGLTVSFLPGNGRERAWPGPWRTETALRRKIDGWLSGNFAKHLLSYKLERKGCLSLSGTLSDWDAISEQLADASRKRKPGVGVVF